MFKSKPYRNIKKLYFKKFTGKSYAVFVSLGKIIHIARLSINTLIQGDLKAKFLLAPVFNDSLLVESETDDEYEEVLLPEAMPIPVLAGAIDCPGSNVRINSPSLFKFHQIFHTTPVFYILNSSCAKTNVSDAKTSISRLAKAEKAEFNGVNEHFSDERNEEIGVFALTLNSKLRYPFQVVNDYSFANFIRYNDYRN